MVFYRLNIIPKAKINYLLQCSRLNFWFLSIRAFRYQSELMLELRSNSFPLHTHALLHIQWQMRRIFTFIHTHTYQSINHITCLHVAHHRQCLVLRNNAYDFPTASPLAANVCSIANYIAKKIALHEFFNFHWNSANLYIYKFKNKRCVYERKNVTMGTIS